MDCRTANRLGLNRCQADLRELAYDFLDEAKRLETQKRPVEAAAYVDATWKLGLHVMQSEPRNMLLSLAGVGCIAAAADLNASTNPSSQPAKVAGLPDAQAVRKKFASELGSALQRP